MTLEALSGVVRYSRTHLARIETAEAVPPPDLSARLDACFGTDGHFGRLYRLARREGHPDQYRRRMELEERAVSIIEYAPFVVPGLLQTERYARAIFNVGNPSAPAESVDDLVTARLSRQAILKGAKPARLSVVLEESAITRTIGGPEVMHEQLRSLLPWVEGPTSLLQVLPHTHGAHSLMGGMLALSTLDNGTTVAYEESITTGRLIEDPETVRRCTQACDVLRAYARSPAETAEFIRSVLEELPHEHHP
ncbi:helix-turn-helix transcriptional regulator [Streptomyces synnematoformans]